MTDQISKDKNVALVVYILLALPIIGALFGPVGGLPAIAAVIMAYIKKPENKDTWLESHFRWQINTFWIALIGTFIGVLTIVVFIGLIILPAVTIWVVYRIAKGWMALNDEKAVG